VTSWPLSFTTKPSGVPEGTARVRRGTFVSISAASWAAASRVAVYRFSPDAVSRSWASRAASLNDVNALATFPSAR